MNRYKIVWIFSISFIVILSVSAIIVNSQSYTKEGNITFEQTCIDPNKSMGYSTSDYDTQVDVTPENVFEYEFKKNALPLLNLSEQDIITEIISETQIKIKINKNLEDIEYIQLCSLLNTLKYFYYPDDTITVFLVLPNDEKEITPRNPVEATQNGDEIFISLEEVTKFK